MLWLVNWPHQPSTSVFVAVACPFVPTVIRIRRPLLTQPSVLLPGPLGGPRQPSLAVLGASQYGAF